MFQSWDTFKYNYSPIFVFYSLDWMYVQFCSAGGIPPAPIRLQYFKWTAHTHLTPPATCEFCIQLDWLRGVINTHFNKWYSSLLANTHLNITIFIRYCVTGQNKTVHRLGSRPPAQREVGDARLGIGLAQICSKCCLLGYSPIRSSYYQWEQHNRRSSSSLHWWSIEEILQ